MKLRCVENSIRLRLRRSEVAQLAEDGYVKESVSFPLGNTFTYVLQTGKVESIKVTFKDYLLQIILPIDQTMNWVNTNEVGIETELPLATEQKLHILIEKDFPCKTRPDEDKSDTFQELANDDNVKC